MDKRVLVAIPERQQKGSSGSMLFAKENSAGNHVMQRSSGILMCGSIDVILAMEIYAMSHAKSMPSLESQQYYRL